MTDVLQYDFMRYAFFAGLLASVACGIIGSFIVAKRIVFISGGISHASFGGVGLGYLLNIHPLLGALLFSVLAAFGIGALSRQTKYREDLSIGIFWAVGMSLGVLFIALSEGYTPDLFTYLFGNILAVSVFDLKVMFFLDAVVLGCVGFFYKEFLYLSFDEEYTEARGVPVTFLYLFLLVVIALTVVTLMKIMGIILVVALLTLPAATSIRFSHCLKHMILWSVLFSVFSILAGLWLSYRLDLPSGAVIVLFSSAVFLLSHWVKP